MINKIWRVHTKYLVLISIIVIITFLLLFYPSGIANVDEYDYLKNSQLILDRGLQQECTLGSFSQFDAGEYCVSKYNIGTSILLLPAAFTNPHIAFLISAATFLIGVVVFSRILVLLKIPKYFTYLYTFFPAFVYFSRTLMSETFSATFIVIILYLLFKLEKEFSQKWSYILGNVIGFAVLIRYSNVIPIGFLIIGFIVLWFRQKKLGRNEIVSLSSGLIAGGLPWLAIFLGTNQYLYGHPLRSGYFFSGEEDVFLNFQTIWGTFRYLGILLLMYPLLAVGGLFSKLKYKWIFFLTSLTLILFYSGFPTTVFEGRILDLIFGIRFILPMIPLLLVGYASWLTEFESKKRWKIFCVFGLFILLVSAFLISAFHQDFLNQLSYPFNHVFQEIG